MIKIHNFKKGKYKTTSAFAWVVLTIFEVINIQFKNFKIKSEELFYDWFGDTDEIALYEFSVVIIEE